MHSKMSMDKYRDQKDLQEKGAMTHSGNKSEPVGVVGSVRSQLLALDEEQAKLVLRIVCSYVQSMNLATGSEAKLVAQEILQECIVEALDHADRFDPTRQLIAWLLGIALNIIRHKKVEAAKRHHREYSLNQLAGLYAEPLNENDLLDQFASSAQLGPEEVVVSDEQAQALLALVSADDQQILRLAFLEDFGREALAQRLGLTSGAARVRLHRALTRLRTAWAAQQAETRRGEVHE
jgi:RNA polymerase sigma factor (sigma-70 family)